MEGNEVIARFMNYTNPHDPNHVLLKYHTSWDWLMPVVEKISQMRCSSDNLFDHDTFYPRTFGMLSPEGRKPMVRLNRCEVYEEDTLIEATYKAVVSFIDWYNNTSQTLKK